MSFTDGAAIEMGHDIASASGCITTQTVSSPEQWTALLSQLPFAHSVQAFGYGDAKAGVDWRVSRVLLLQDGEPVATVQALEKRVLGVRVVTRINPGPMFLQAKPDAATVVAVYRAIRQRWGRFPCGVLLIAPALEESEDNHKLLAQAGFRPRRGNGWGSARVDLDRDVDAIFASLDGDWRNRIRAGTRAGVSVQVAQSQADHEWMIERHMDNMADKGFRAHDADFLRALRQHAGDDYVLVQARHEGEPVAGIVMLKVGALADGIVAWFGPDARKLKACNVMVWEAMLEMKRRGCTSYDVGGTNSDRGFSKFKGGMRGTAYTLLGEYVSF